MTSGWGNPRAEKYVWALSTGFCATDICAEFSCGQLTRAWNLLEQAISSFLRIDTPTKAHLILHWRTNHHDDIFGQACVQLIEEKRKEAITQSSKLEGLQTRPSLRKRSDDSFSLGVQGAVSQLCRCYQQTSLSQNAAIRLASENLLASNVVYSKLF